MKARFQERLQELRREFESGQKVLADLEGRKTEVQSTLLRISGAIQVLEELLGQDGGEDSGQRLNGLDDQADESLPDLREESHRQL